MPGLRSALGGGTAVLTAEPGAGKTTVVPLRLLGEIGSGAGSSFWNPAGWRPGRRHADGRPARRGGRRDRRLRHARRPAHGKATRVEVVTEGILTRRLQADPSLPGTALVVFDEFHERHLQSDLGLAFTLDARDGLRPDLRVLVMSATLDAGPVAALLGGAPVMTSAGRTFPVEVRWAPRRRGPAGFRRGRRRAPRAGRRPRRCAGVPARRGRDPGGHRRPRDPAGVEVLPLHGSLPAAAQDRALRAGARRGRAGHRPGRDQRDGRRRGSGGRRRAGPPPRLRPGQRPDQAAHHGGVEGLGRPAGRAGRAPGPGVAYRLWSQAEHASRRPWPDPEIVSTDLAGLALELAVWGAAPGELRWLDPPPTAALEKRWSCSKSSAQPMAAGPPTSAANCPPSPSTPAWRRCCWPPRRPHNAPPVCSPPCSPNGTSSAATARAPPPTWPPAWPFCAVTAGAGRRGPGGPGHRAPPGQELERRAGRPADGQQDVDPGPLLAAAYPDRIAQARGAGRYRLRHGGGAVLADHDPLAGTAWLVAADVEGARRAGRGRRPDPPGRRGRPGGRRAHRRGAIRTSYASNGTKPPTICEWSPNAPSTPSSSTPPGGPPVREPTPPPR